MRAFRVTRRGEAPELVDIPTPGPGAGEIGLKIEACGLNFADLLMVKGTYQETPEPPFTLGLEVAGVVTGLGPGVAGPAPGTRVAVFAGQGGLAEHGAFPADRAVPIPDTMPAHEAAGFLVAYGTSHLALTRRARLKAGERLVVLGAAGGVGLTAVEIGALIGAEVIAVARGAEKLEVAKAAGATHLIDSTGTDDLRAALRDLGGVDVVYDAVGGDQFRDAMRATRPEGRIIVIGFASGDVPRIPANHLLVKNISVEGFYWGGYMAFAPEAVTSSLAELFAWYEAGRIKPHVSATFPLAQAADALELLRSRKSTGKVVVTMD
ncbi:zinc-binding dehydrogenase [Rhodobacterales bacterium HKCCE3408]|nr:zinc-binding dehydrogenase [Rhodobacterales bacterium HKCCE3408]